MWNIYSVGDSFFLQQIFNAVAAICGSADFTSACAIAMLIGVFIIAFQTIIRQQGINIHHILICYVLWFACYYPTTSVNIHDIYTQQSRKVDNVPIGVAVVGSIVSTIGFKVTEMMEVAFQAPDSKSTLTGAGAGEGGRYANSLYMLNSILRGGVTEDLLQPLQMVSGDYKTSLTNYIKDCTYKALQIGKQNGGKTRNDILMLPVDEAIRFDTDTYYTRIYIDRNQVKDLTCRAAFKVLKEQFDTAYADGNNNEDLKKLILRLGLIDKSKEDAAIWGEVGASNIEDAISIAVTGLTNGTDQAMKFVLASMSYNIFNDAIAQGHADYLDQITATMIYQATQQRNYQWAAEQTMFFQTLRPMMTFVEGFAYAVTPFAGFILLLGIMGISLFTKYLIMLIWVQLWLPTIAICNAMVLSSARKALLEFTYSDSNLGSFYAVDKIHDVVSTSIAVGGMFTAAVPILSFILITGSAYALTSLTNRMAGADHINEKIVSPDAVTPGTGLAMQGLYSADSKNAAIRTGSEAIIPTINLANIGSNVQSRAHTNTLASQKSLTEAINNAEQISSTNTYNDLTSFVLSNNKNSDFTNALSQITSSVNSQLGAKNQSVDSSQVLTSIFSGGFGGSANASAGLGTSQLGASVGASASVNKSGSSADSIKSSSGLAVNNAVSQALQSNKDIAAKIAQGISSALSDTNSLAETLGIGISEAKSISQSANSLAQSATSESEVTSYQQNIGTSQSINLVEAVKSMSDEAKNKFNRDYDTMLNNLDTTQRNMLNDSVMHKLNDTHNHVFTIGSENHEILSKLWAMSEYKRGGSEFVENLLYTTVMGTKGIRPEASTLSNVNVDTNSILQEQQSLRNSVADDASSRMFTRGDLASLQDEGNTRVTQFNVAAKQVAGAGNTVNRANYNNAQQTVSNMINSQSFINDYDSTNYLRYEKNDIGIKNLSALGNGSLGQTLIGIAQEHHDSFTMGSFGVERNASDLAPYANRIYNDAEFNSLFKDYSNDDRMKIATNLAAGAGVAGMGNQNAAIQIVNDINTVKSGNSYDDTQRTNSYSYTNHL